MPRPWPAGHHPTRCRASHPATRDHRSGRTKEIRHVRLATITTAQGPRLHVRGRSGYIDVAGGTGDPRMSELAYVLAAGEPAMSAIHHPQPHRRRTGRARRLAVAPRRQAGHRVLTRGRSRPPIGGRPIPPTQHGDGGDLRQHKQLVPRIERVLAVLAISDGRTCSAAARSGWRAPRRNWRPAPSSSSRSSAGTPGGPATRPLRRGMRPAGAPGACRDPSLSPAVPPDRP
jgi:hypothetical protein